MIRKASDYLQSLYGGSFLIAENKQQLLPMATGLLELTDTSLRAYQQLARRIDSTDNLSWVEPVNDIRNQIDELLSPGFLQRAGAKWLRRYPTYFAAIDRRLDAVDKSPEQDRRKRAELQPLWEDLQALLDVPAAEEEQRIELNHCRWLFEELRVSVYAQSLGTVEKVSIQRLENRIQQYR